MSIAFCTVLGILQFLNLDANWRYFVASKSSLGIFNLFEYLKI